MLFEPLGYGILLSRFGVAEGSRSEQKGNEVAFPQIHQLRNETGKNEMDLLS